VPIGYIRLSQFNANAVAELAHAIARLEKQEPTLIFSICGIILVVCCKPELNCRLWLEQGTVVYTVNHKAFSSLKHLDQR